MRGPMERILVGAVIAAAVLLFAAQNSEAHRWNEDHQEMYRVVNVRGLDVVHMRRSPDETAAKTGELSFDARDLYGLGECTPDWCLVSFRGEVSGWVSRRYIAADNDYGVTTYSVVGVSKYDVLNIRNGPNSDAEIVGAIPPFEITVEALGSCAGDWCPVGYKAIQGWVQRNYLTVWMQARPDDIRRIGGF